jgi:hypothetical protein
MLSAVSKERYLSADPASHVHVAVGRSCTLWVDAKTHARVARFAVGASPARNVEGHRHHVAHLDKLHSRAALNHFSGDLVAKDDARLRGGAAAVHVHVTAADAARNDAQDDAVRTRTVLLCEMQRGERDVLHRHRVGPLEHHATIHRL